MAKTSGNKELVHIRCCYNNKYWVRATNELDQDEYMIVAGADEPEEDQSKSSCTLFEPIFVDQVNEDDDNEDGGNYDDHGKSKTKSYAECSKGVRFFHVQMGRYAMLHNSGGLLLQPTPAAATDEPTKRWRDACTIIDWELLVILPKHVAFKNENEPYLSAQWIDDDPYLQFQSSQIEDPTVGNEVFTTSNGSICIKSDYFGKFWRCTLDDWIWPDCDIDPTGNNCNHTLFWPVKINDYTIALRSLGNNCFCKRYTIRDIVSGLSANVPNIQIYARLGVEELVKYRKIYNVKYRTMHTRICDYENGMEIATGEAVNLTQETRTIGLKLSYQKGKSSAWNNASSLTLKLGLKMNIQAAGIPFIGDDGKIRIDPGDQFIGDVKWGETEELEVAVEGVCKVSVPAMSMVKVRLMATKASYEVPFSYSRRDTQTNGHVQVTHDLDDGVYTSSTSFNFKYETKEQKL